MERQYRHTASRRRPRTERVRTEQVRTEQIYTDTGKKTAGSYTDAAGSSLREQKIQTVSLRELARRLKRGRVERDLRVDNVRGALIILVVIGHFLLPLYWTRLVTNLIYLIYVFHMPCFVMISGFYAKNICKKGRFRWGKIVQLLWLYFVFKMMVHITEGMLAGRLPLFPDFLHESGAPWYLFSLSVWYLSIPLMRRFREYPLNAIVIVSVMIAVIFIKYFVTVEDFLCIDRTLSFAPFFYIGYFYNQENLDSYLAGRARKGIGILAPLFAAAVFFLTYDHLMLYHIVVYGAQYNRYFPDLFPWLWLVNLVWYLIAFIMSMGLIGVMPGCRMRVLTKLGQRSLQVYMLHRPIRDLLQYFGMYEVLSAHSKLTVLLVVLSSALLAVLLGTDPVYRGFQHIRTAPDRLLLKLGAL
ncbi:MAG: acyltransferase family protein [Eubacteriales bacterium]|nr:acyltransferase family protein [Eubacteriales bacterium]